MSEKLKVDIARDFKGVTCKHRLLSEKYDGVQGVWDGFNMLTRTGNPIKIPTEWTKELPTVPLIGELWVDRGEFEFMSGTARGAYDMNRWGSVKYMVFKSCPDVPVGKYAQHIKRKLIEKEGTAHKIYEKVIRLGGEGIMLSRPDDLEDVIKVKPVYDMDGRVVGYKEGKGRNQGRAGALLLVDKHGKGFKVGSGLTDALRNDPPKIGSIVKVSYTGLTRFNVPRFARYVGIRAEEDFV